MVSPTVRTLCKENCFCPWLLQDRKRKLLLLSPLTDPSEGLPAHVLYRLIHSSKPFLTLSTALVSSGAQLPCTSSRVGEMLWGSDNLLQLLVLRDVSLKLWPNRWVLRTFSPSSAEAASSAHRRGRKRRKPREAFFRIKEPPPTSASSGGIYGNASVFDFS